MQIQDDGDIPAAVQLAERNPGLQSRPAQQTTGLAADLEGLADLEDLADLRKATQVSGESEGKSRHRSSLPLAGKASESCNDWVLLILTDDRIYDVWLGQGTPWRAVPCTRRVGHLWRMTALGPIMQGLVDYTKPLRQTCNIPPQNSQKNLPVLYFLESTGATFLQKSSHQSVRPAFCPRSTLGTGTHFPSRALAPLATLVHPISATLVPPYHSSSISCCSEDGNP